MADAEKIVVLEGARTPVGSFGGGQALAALLRRVS
jgi:hypothetical protein